jgi:ABC-type Mn2+/Zn2+ transport system permease subunit
VELWNALVGSVADPLSYPFMQRALLGCVLVGLICAVLGTFVVLQKLAFIGQGLAQGALPGLAIGFVIGVNLYLSALACALGLAALIAFLRERGRVASDTAIAIVFSAAAAAGIAAISLARFGPIDVNSYMFGNVLAIGVGDLLILIVAALVLGALLLVLYKELTFATFDPESAAAAGVPVRALAYLFHMMIAVVVVVSLQTVGLILVTSMLVIPAASARQWAERLPSMLALAALFGMGSALIGLYTSFYLRLPSGATIVLTLAIIFVISFIGRGLRDRQGRRAASLPRQAAYAVSALDS